ncbi:MAG: 4'-phosphopantetheinyl transferase superfamily protein [Alphaproteobacteria bacterium]|nr:4'-phosphopantetheinyl transferase superfamily protein [Alphaproteobacteria bacterium]
MLLENMFCDQNNEHIEATCFWTNAVDLDPEPILTKTEKGKYTSFKVENPRQDFLLGRYCAKKAYLQLRPSSNENMRSLEIKNGIFEQPFFCNDASLGVSISHDHGVAAALVFDRSFPMGIDIEHWDENKSEAINSISTYEEVFQITDIDTNKAFAIAWCLKEAVSKAIGTGFTIPTQLLKIEAFTQRREAVYSCGFFNFTQYKGIALLKDNIIIAIAYPQQLYCRF